MAFMAGDPSDKAFLHMKHIRQIVEDLHIPHNPEVSTWVTISVGGVTVVPRRDIAYEDFLKIADAMLYDAKKLGRNQVVWADENMKQLREDRAGL